MLAKQFHDIKISLCFHSKIYDIRNHHVLKSIFASRYPISCWGMNFSAGTGWSLVLLLQLNERTERQGIIQDFWHIENSIFVWPATLYLFMFWLHGCSASDLMMWVCGSTSRFLYGKKSQAMPICYAHCFLDFWQKPHFPTHPNPAVHHCHLLFSCLYPSIPYGNLSQPKTMEINLYIFTTCLHAVSLYSSVFSTLNFSLPWENTFLSVSQILLILVH